MCLECPRTQPRTPPAGRHRSSPPRVQSVCTSSHTTCSGPPSVPCSARRRAQRRHLPRPQRRPLRGPACCAVGHGEHRPSPSHVSPHAETHLSRTSAPVARRPCPQTTLAGAVVPLDTCVRNLVEYTQCGVHEALAAVTTHPAKCVWRRLEGWCGMSLRRGQNATYDGRGVFVTAEVCS